jgi:hypothetical protein
MSGLGRYCRKSTESGHLRSRELFRAPHCFSTGIGPADVLLGWACLQGWPQIHANESAIRLIAGCFRFFTFTQSGDRPPRFNARMIPIRANIVGPPDVATRIKASMAACHSAASCSAFLSFVMYLPASSRVARLRPRGSGIGSSNRRFQPRSATRAP